MPYRDDVLDAAITVLGSAGRRQLTHRAVDGEAGLPAGSTSNHFRTRKALVEGIVGRLAELDHRDFAALESVDILTREGLCRFTIGWMRDAVTAGRDRTAARYAMFLEAAADPDLREPLREARRTLIERVEDMVRPLAADPAMTARLLTDWVEGAVLHQLCLPDSGTFPHQATVAQMIDAVLDR